MPFPEKRKAILRPFRNACTVVFINAVSGETKSSQLTRQSLLVNFVFINAVSGETKSSESKTFSSTEEASSFH